MNVLLMLHVPYSICSEDSSIKNTLLSLIIFSILHCTMKAMH